jgi:pimeloyl-ACP methyl ester carboxylesterase
MPFFKTTDDVSLFYHDWGTGRPVVLIHGWPLNADFWERGPARDDGAHADHARRRRCERAA